MRALQHTFRISETDFGCDTVTRRAEKDTVGAGATSRQHFLVMAGLVPPARPKPLRRGEGPAIHVFLANVPEDVDARRKAGHDDFDAERPSASCVGLHKQRRAVMTKPLNKVIQPVPEDAQSHKGPGSAPSVPLDTTKGHRDDEKHNIREQAAHGNLVQNTSHRRSG
jgi:hypothetical protein